MPVDGLFDRESNVTLSPKLWPDTGPLGLYPRWSSRTTDATMAYHIACAIPLLAHLTNRYGLRRHDGKPFRFQHMLVGRSGASKSTAWHRAEGAYTAVCGALGISEAPGVLTLSGSLPGLFEALGEMREPDTDWHYGMLWHEEMSSFLRNHRQESLAEFMCMLADGTRYERHLRGVKQSNRQAAGSAIERIDKHAFQGVYITTFDVLRSVAKPEYVNGGAFSRWGWFVGPEAPYHAMTYDELLEERPVVIEAFVDTMQWIAGQSLFYAQRQEPFRMTLDKKARDWAIRPIYDELCAETSDAMICLQKRGLELATQYASMFAINEHRTHVGASDYEKAANLVSISLDGYRRLLPRIGATGGSPHEVARSKIDDAFNAIRKAPAGLSRSDLHRILARPGKSVLDEVMSTLLDEDLVEEVVQPAKSADGRGRPSVRYTAKAKRRDV